MELIVVALGAPCVLGISMLLRKDTSRWALPTLIAALAFNCLLVITTVPFIKDASKPKAAIETAMMSTVALPVAIAVWLVWRKPR